MTSQNDRPYIRVVSPEEAAADRARYEFLLVHYDAAVRRAGKVFNIIRMASLRPDFIGASMGLYRVAMFAPSGLSRSEREMVATAVSFVNHCHY